MVDPIQHRTIMRAEVTPDVYAGNSFNEVKNRFTVSSDGDMKSSTNSNDIVLQCKQLPPGTRITVNYPCCPGCGTARKDKTEFIDGLHQIVGHVDKCDCGFDWNEWVLDQYS